MKQPIKTVFDIALDARENKIDPNILRGAPKQLYNDKTITNEMLKEYSTHAAFKRDRTINPPPKKQAPVPSIRVKRT